MELVNGLIERMEARNAKKQIHEGDAVQFTNEYGVYYPAATVVDMIGEKQICEHASGYLTHGEAGKIFFNFSGGAFNSCDIRKFEYVGTTEKTFWTFGHCGACAHGGIYFHVDVNLWKYDVHETEFTTETHDKYYLSYRKSENKYDYQYFASQSGANHAAWETEEEFQSWLRTHRAVISKEYTTVAWTYKEVEHHCSPAEYDALNAPEDIFLMNGSKRRCKRIYDDDNYIMHTYFVWYWEHDLTKYAEENTVIESYTVDYFKNEVNSIALEELHSGKIKPLKIDFE